jgi:hypothetical protein
MPWPELKEKLLALPKTENPVFVERLGNIIDEDLFVKKHIMVVDSIPPGDKLTQRQKHFRVHIVYPHYNRLLAYYTLKTQL